MRFSVRAGLVIAACALLRASTGMAQTAAAPPTGVTQALIDQGDKVFHGPGLCYACHGSDAKGLVGPNLTDDVWLHNKGSYDEIVAQINKGVTPEEALTPTGKGGMPPKGGSSISDDDVKAVAAYVWSLSHKGS